MRLTAKAKVLTLAFTILANTSMGVAAATPEPNAIQNYINQIYPQVEALYHDLHANPELGFEEVNTAAKLAEQMRALGFEVTENVGKTGVVALYKNGKGPTIMVRTELDALPMEEKTDLAYASKAKAQYDGIETFVAHSCGHDLHMAAWVGTAQTLLKLKDQWQGTLMFIAQPAEEIGTGAQAMIDDGLFTRFAKPDFAFALHTDPMAYGTVGYRAGPISSAANDLDITFFGRGGHGSAPHKAIDPIIVAANFISNVQNVVSRQKAPSEFGVVTIGSIQGGSAGNIIPDSVRLQGTIRSYDPEVREQLVTGIRRTALSTAEMAAAPTPKISLEGSASAIINDAKVVEQAVQAMKAQLGEANVVEVPPITASEDFSVFVDAGIPSMFFLVGVTDPKLITAANAPNGKPVPFNHSPFFAPVPEPSIKTGVQAMTAAVLSALKP